MKEVRVFAPATVANVAVGFDILGFAINRPGDEIVARLHPDIKGLKISGLHFAQAPGKRRPGNRTGSA